MFSFSGSSIKTKLATAAVVAVGAAGLTASSASAWSPSGPDTLIGNLSVTLSSGPQLSADVEFDVDLDAGSANTGTVDAVRFSNETANPPLFDPVATADVTPPWAISGTRTNPDGSGTATISGVSFTSDLRVGGSSVGSVTVTGNVTGSYSGPFSTLSFAAAPGLSVTSATGVGVAFLGNTAALVGSVTGSGQVLE